MSKSAGFSLISLLRFHRRSCKGFTLMELLVVVAIMAGLVTLILPQLTKYSTYGTLKDGTDQLHSALRATQNNASSGTKCADNVSASLWYLQFNNDNKSFRIGPICSDQDSSPTPTPIPATSYTLPNGISIGHIEVSSCHGNDLRGYSTPVEVQFDNITGMISFKFDTINSGCPAIQPQNRMVITLQRDADSSDTREIIIEKGGAIYTNQ